MEKPIKPFNERMGKKLVGALACCAVLCASDTNNDLLHESVYTPLFEVVTELCDDALGERQG